MGAGVVIPALEIVGVPPGAHAVRAGAFRYHAETVEAEVEGAGTVAVEVALHPGASAGCVDHDHGQGGSDG